MNTALIVVLGFLMMVALMQGIMWLVIGTLALIVILAFMGNKQPTNQSMFYRTPQLPPVSPGMPEHLLKLKHQPDWSGHEDDDEYANLVAENWGSGLGRGFGFFK